MTHPAVTNNLNVCVSEQASDRRVSDNQLAGDGGAGIRMHVVIMGCGRVGSTLASAIEASGHSVAVIDKDVEAFRRLPPTYTGATVVGMGFDREVLIEADVERADAFAAVSSGDNSNIISARVARENFGVSNVIARIYDSRRAEVYERLGIPTIATVRWTAHRMLRALLPHEAEPEIWRDPTSTVAIVELQIHPEWIGRTVTSLEQTSGARVAFVNRFGQGTLPTASTVIQDGDQVFSLVTDTMKDQVLAVAAAAPQLGGH